MASQCGKAGSPSILPQTPDLAPPSRVLCQDTLARPHFAAKKISAPRERRLPAEPLPSKIPPQKNLQIFQALLAAPSGRLTSVHIPGKPYQENHDDTTDTTKTGRVFVTVWFQNCPPPPNVFIQHRRRRARCAVVVAPIANPTNCKTRRIKRARPCRPTPHSSTPTPHPPRQNLGIMRLLVGTPTKPAIQQSKVASRQWPVASQAKQPHPPAPCLLPPPHWPLAPGPWRLTPCVFPCIPCALSDLDPGKLPRLKLT